ncbi:MAG: hypothetical protein KIT00_06845 [Rhodospirillales bacterium]|nr:hypothetical protein [Rhodospirillales bacterium]
MPWHAMRTIGDKLRHEYQRVCEVLLWGIVDVYADLLKTTIEDMLDKHSDG